MFSLEIWKSLWIFHTWPLTTASSTHFRDFILMVVVHVLNKYPKLEGSRFSDLFIKTWNIYHQKPLIKFILFYFFLHEFEFVFFNLTNLGCLFPWLSREWASFLRGSLLTFFHLKTKRREHFHWSDEINKYSRGNVSVCVLSHKKVRIVEFAWTHGGRWIKHRLRWPRVTTHLDRHASTHNMSACAQRPGRPAALTLTAGEEPSPGCDPCITPWWPLTSSSRFALTTPSAAVGAEGATFVPTSAQLLLLLCVVRASEPGGEKKAGWVRGREGGRR